MANEIVLTSREKERQGGRQAGFVGREVGSTEETRTDALKVRGKGEWRCIEQAPDSSSQLPPLVLFCSALSRAVGRG